MFLIRHDFKEGQAEAWWQSAQELMADEAKMKGANDAANAKGFHNDAFMATAPEGPCFCIWEGPKGATADEMTAFIDKAEESPAGETAFDNKVMALDTSLNPSAPLSTILA